MSGDDVLLLVARDENVSTYWLTVMLYNTILSMQQEFSIKFILQLHFLGLTDVTGVYFVTRTT
jgi:hypothetical protein